MAKSVNGEGVIPLSISIGVPIVAVTKVIPTPHAAVIGDAVNQYLKGVAFFLNLFGGLAVDAVDDEGAADVLKPDNGVHLAPGHCIDEVNDGRFIAGVVRWRQDGIFGGGYNVEGDGGTFTC